MKTKIVKQHRWRWAVLGLAVLALHCGKSTLTVEPIQLDTYFAQKRVGIQSISIEQSRVIRYFGFLGVSSYPARFDLHKVKELGGKAGYTNQISLEIQNGRIVGRPIIRGTLEPNVDTYISDIVSRWQNSDGPRFTDFVERLNMKIILDQGGTIQIEYSELQVTQPDQPSEAYRFFNHVSRDPAKMRFVLPVNGFNITAVKTTEAVDRQIQTLNSQLARWRRQPIPAG
jgi:hypothetical protein